MHITQYIQYSNKMNCSKKFKISLKNYVNNMELSHEISCIIERGIKTYGDEVSSTCYRGKSSHEIDSKYWFSASSSHDVAKKIFAGNNGIVYIIHIVNTHAINVNEILTKDDIGQHSEENEIIVEGKGKFYNNNLCLVEGFCKINENLYETWYTTQIIENSTIEINANKITEKRDENGFDIEEFCKNNMEELEMIDSLDELKCVFAELNNCSDEFVEKIYNFSKNINIY